MWRGPALSDFTYEAFAAATIAQLEELRLAALEERVEADLALGRSPDLVGELAALVQRNPLRERLPRQLMLALYRCGRQTEALAVYQGFRQALSEELGLDPSSAWLAARARRSEPRSIARRRDHRQAREQ